MIRYRQKQIGDTFPMSSGKGNNIRQPYGVKILADML